MEQEEQIEKKAKRNWLYIISPCIIAAVFSVVMIVGSFLSMSSSGGWSFIGVLMFFPFLAVVVGIDAIVKLVVNRKVLYVWIIELLMIAVVVLLFREYYIFI